MRYTYTVLRTNQEDIIIIKKGRQCKAGIADPISPKTPTPQHQPIEWKKRTGKQQETKSERAARPIGPALETRQSHTIEHGVTKIVPQRY